MTLYKFFYITSSHIGEAVSKYMISSKNSFKLTKKTSERLQTAVFVDCILSEEYFYTC